MNDIGDLSDGLPVLSRYDQFRKRAAAVRKLWGDAVEIERASIGEQRLWLQRHEAATSLIASLSRDLALLQRKATRSQIVDALLPLNDLPKATPGAKNILAQRVGAQEPTIGAVNLAALMVLDTEEWFPPPAKMLRALEAAEQSLKSIELALQCMPRSYRHAVDALAESERSELFEIERRTARIAYLQSLTTDQAQT